MARGLLAEINRIAKHAAREAERSQSAAEWEPTAAARHAEQAKKSVESATTQLARAREQDRKRFEKEAIEARVETQIALKAFNKHLYKL